MIRSSPHDFLSLRAACGSLSPHPAGCFGSPADSVGIRPPLRVVCPTQPTCWVRLNLNISCYITIAVGEEEIDLAATNQTLVDIEKDIAKALNTHNGFLKELGLPLLPMHESQ